MSDTTDRLPVVRTDTAPLPRITGDGPPVIHVTYPELGPEALDAAYAATTGGVFNQQVYRALGHIAGGVQRHRHPAEITRRAAVILLADPLGGTPFRCPLCGTRYTAPPAPADWAIAGREDLPCRLCTLAQSSPAKTITITPEQARRSRRRATTRRPA
jgi:hypothetical protein